jgi:hypothetical protein
LPYYGLDNWFFGLRINALFWVGWLVLDLRTSAMFWAGLDYWFLDLRINALF